MFINITVITVVEYSEIEIQILRIVLEKFKLIRSRYTYICQREKISLRFHESITEIKIANINVIQEYFHVKKTFN